MGVISLLKGARDSAKAAKIERANAAVASGGSGKGGKGGKGGIPEGRCGFSWEDKGIPGSLHASYPHKDHWCGDTPHNRGTHHCWGGENWSCAATHS